MKRGDVAVPLEISGIEREDALDRVYVHSGNEAGVINLDALDFVVPYNLLPTRIRQYFGNRRRPRPFAGATSKLHGWLGS